MALLAVAKLPFTTGKPEDVAINNFAVLGTQAEHEIADVAAAVRNFYTTEPPGGISPGFMGYWIGGAVSRVTNACSVSVYDLAGHLDGSPHGSPLYTLQFTMPAAASAESLPDEIALAVTLHATGRSTAPVETPDGVDAGGALDRPRQRLTGKVYLGPLDIEASNRSGTDVRPSANFRQAAREAIKQLNADLLADAAGLGLAVWSRANGAMVGLEAVSTDDAFDTQRRRGRDQTARVTLALP